MDRLPIEPFQEAFARSGISVCEMARRMEVDESRVRQYLGRHVHYTKGVLKDGTVRHYQSRTKNLSYDVALKFCEALDLDPVDLGV